MLKLLRANITSIALSSIAVFLNCMRENTNTQQYFYNLIFAGSLAFTCRSCLSSYFLNDPSLSTYIKEILLESFTLRYLCCPLSFHLEILSQMSPPVDIEYCVSRVRGRENCTTQLETIKFLWISTLGVPIVKIKWSNGFGNRRHIVKVFIKAIIMRQAYCMVELNKSTKKK